MTKEIIIEEFESLIYAGESILLTKHETNYTGICVDSIQ